MTYHRSRGSSVGRASAPKSAFLRADAYTTISATTLPNVTAPAGPHHACATAAIEKIAKWKSFLVYGAATPRRRRLATAAPTANARTPPNGAMRSTVLASGTNAANPPFCMLTVRS
jgi:hypothetical protein